MRSHAVFASSIMRRCLIIALFGGFFVGMVPSLCAQGLVALKKFPYAESGFTERQAAAYLLDRFSFGARSGDVDSVLHKGLVAWFEEQLRGGIPEDPLQTRLQDFSTLRMSNEEIAHTFPNVGLLLRQAMQDGVISKADRTDMEKAEYRQTLRKYGESKGYRPKRQLYGEMYAQKMLRALYSPNQLHEVLTDFWFNHFNVSITDNQADQYVLPYERDAIRPNVVGNFRTLLGATAKHPAMLAYLDNAQSTAPEGTPTTLSLRLDSIKMEKGAAGAMKRRFLDGAQKRGKALRDSALQQIPAELRPQRGINENYARELMELHTLGVDGGYTQRDVTEAARILTGWTVYPYNIAREGRAKKLAEWLERGESLGFMRQGDFLFRADAHDATEKTFLGRCFPAGGTINEGEELLDILAENPATARFICTKLARRFVADVPPEPLVQRMVANFAASKGNIAEVLRAMVSAPEFWTIAIAPTPATAALVSSQATPQSNNKKSENGKKSSKKPNKKKATEVSNGKTFGASFATTTAQTTFLRSKIKSPFELAVSALRALNADVQRPREVLEWVRKIGQPLYAYQAPTGFPDRATAWINTGSLLNRMNFGINLASGNIGGVSFDLAALNNFHEPQSLEDALQTYTTLLLPERNNAETVRLLKPVLADPTFAQKLDNAAQASGEVSTPMAENMRSGAPLRAKASSNPKAKSDTEHDVDWEEHAPSAGMQKTGKQDDGKARKNAVSASGLAQVVGIILGSPEFQRR